MKIKKAFTLAEVLITLGIIGVVAAMTIPTLVADYQKTQYVTGLKKAYTTFNQMLLVLTTDYGCQGDAKCTGLFANGTTTLSLGDEIVKYYKEIINCKTSGIDSRCVANVYKTSYDGGGSTQILQSSGNYRFLTADGISIIISNRSDNCTTNYDANDSNSRPYETCAIVYFDVNGKKAPNFFGKDTFAYYITNKKGVALYPFGGAETLGHWKNSSGNPLRCYSGNTDGLNCAGRIIEEGWQMNY